MERDYRRRAAARRASWFGAAARSFDEHERQGMAFWDDAPDAAKLEATWRLLVDAWAMKGRHGPAPGFQGSVLGVGRFRR
ncbi:MAG: hypothetical protein HY744_27955 [Deltaproteobacteria bacterium]|nr:hypothetical protein [Deltaproteobacteria bacterium]